MKTNYLKRVLAAVSLFMIVAYATAIEPVISITGQKKVVFVLDKITETTNLEIKDANGYAFYSQTIEKSDEKFAKSFDLTTLPDGTYSIEVEGSVKTISYPLNIVDNKVSFSIENKSESFKPTFTVRDNKVFVTKFNPANKPSFMSISNDKGEVVYEETLEGKLDLGRIYNFSKVHGTYTIAMFSDDKTYTQTITVK